MSVSFRTAFGAALLSSAIALPAAAEIVSRDNVTIDFGIGKLVIPKLEADVANRAAFESLFLQGANEPFAARLERVTAERVTIPEMRLEFKLKEAGMTITYSNVAVAKLAGGKAAVLSASGAVQKTFAEGKDLNTQTTGATRIDEADIAFLIRWSTEKRGAGDAPMRVVYKSYSVDGISSRDAGGIELKLGRMISNDFKGRLLASPPSDMIGPLMEMAAQKGKKTKAQENEDAKIVFKFIADAYESIDMGSGEVAGMELKSAVPGAPPVDFKIQKIAYGPRIEGGFTGFAMDGLAVRADGVAFDIGRYAVAGFSFSPMLKHVAETLERTGDIEKVDPFKMIPALGIVKLADIKFDVPPGKSGASKERITGSLKLFEVASGKQINGIPTALRATVEGLSIPVPADSRETGIKDLREMGITRLDLGANIDLAWNQAANELAIKDVSVTGANMGVIKLIGALGGVTPDLFSGDKALMTASVMGATAKSVNLQIENKGIFEKILAKVAKDQKSTPEDLRTQGAAAAQMLPAFAGNAPAAKVVGAALARFIAKPGKLMIDVKSKDAAGLGITDFLAAAGNPLALLDKVAVDARAE